MMMMCRLNLVNGDIIEFKSDVEIGELILRLGGHEGIPFLMNIEPIGHNTKADYIHVNLSHIVSWEVREDV